MFIRADAEVIVVGGFDTGIDHQHHGISKIGFDVWVVEEE